MSEQAMPPERIWVIPDVSGVEHEWHSGWYQGRPNARHTIPYILATPAALAADPEVKALVAEAEARGICPDCANTGLRDSGGSHPWGEPIFLPCDCGWHEKTVRRLHSAIMWARDRIAVDGGMTPKETEATVAELLNVLLGRPSPASSFAPVEDFQSPTLKAIRAEAAALKGA